MVRAPLRDVSSYAQQRARDAITADLWHVIGGFGQRSSALVGTRGDRDNDDC